jgi:hypothetical protein
VLGLHVIELGCVVLYFEHIDEYMINIVNTEVSFFGVPDKKELKTKIQNKNKTAKIIKMIEMEL